MQKKDILKLSSIQNTIMLDAIESPGLKLESFNWENEQKKVKKARRKHCDHIWKHSPSINRTHVPTFIPYEVVNKIPDRTRLIFIYLNEEKTQMKRKKNSWRTVNTKME